MFLNSYDEDDQKNLAKQISAWNLKDDEVFYCMCTGSDKLLFVHRTTAQRHLLEKYGNELFGLNATYKTSLYAVPLLFLVVQTNVDYQVS